MTVERFSVDIEDRTIVRSELLNECEAFIELCVGRYHRRTKNHVGICLTDSEAMELAKALEETALWIRRHFDGGDGDGLARAWSETGRWIDRRA